MTMMINIYLKLLLVAVNEFLCFELLVKSNDGKYINNLRLMYLPEIFS